MVNGMWLSLALLLSAQTVDPAPAAAVDDTPAQVVDAPVAVVDDDGTPQVVEPTDPAGVAPPPPAGPRRERPARTTTAQALRAPEWPVQPGFALGFVLSNGTPQAALQTTLLWPVTPGIGPSFALGGSATLLPGLSVFEGWAGGGVGLEGTLDSIRARVSAMPVLFGHGASDGSSALGIAGLVPVELGLPLGNGTSFTLGATLGMAPSFLHVQQSEVVWERDRLFCLLSAGMTFGGIAQGS